MLEGKLPPRVEHSLDRPIARVAIAAREPRLLKVRHKFHELIEIPI